MKILLLFTFLLFSAFTSDVYKIQLDTLDGAKLKMSDFRGKVILVTGFNAVSPERTLLKFLDSLQKLEKQLAVVAVPYSDQGIVTSSGELRGKLIDLKLGISIVAPAELRKNSGVRQNSLYRWLTDAGENGHFDVDFEAPGQFFLINRSGELYSVLKTGVPDSVLVSLVRNPL
jgi:glutathione peroxidase-family protein